MFPEDGPPMTTKGAAPTGADPQYVKSHGSYNAGEQIRRGYDWTSADIDPATHVFGLPSQNAGRCNAVSDGLRDALHPPPREPDAPTNAMLARKHVLGTPKCTGHCTTHLPPSHAFGLSSSKGEREAGAREVLEGFYSGTDQQPDSDLGISCQR
eukprot:jgi/Botrbrau1/16583/Bobra.0068s0014.1